MQLLKILRLVHFSRESDQGINLLALKPEEEFYVSWVWVLLFGGKCRESNYIFSVLALCACVYPLISNSSRARGGHHISSVLILHHVT